MDVAALVELAIVGLLRASLATIPIFVIVLAMTTFGRRWLAPWARQALWSLVLVRLLLPVSFGSPLSLQTYMLQLWDTVPTRVGPVNAQSPAELVNRSNTAEQTWATATAYSQPLPEAAAL